MTVTYGDTRLPLRFWSKVKRQHNGCWHWAGTVKKKTGYGEFAVTTNSSVPAHRHAFHVLVRPLIPRGQPGHLQVDHDCHNRSKSCPGGPTCLHRRCVNPAHLSPRTPVENVHGSRHTAASKNRAKTHCQRGHELAGDNLRVGPDGRRSCYTCHLARGSEARRQRLAKQRGEGWERRYWQTEKTECKHGHPLSGENLYVDPATGNRACRTCRQATARRHAEAKRTGEVPTGQRADWTRCKHGHAFDEVNTYWYRSGDKWKRACRTCKANRDRR